MFNQLKSRVMKTKENKAVKAAKIAKEKGYRYVTVKVKKGYYHNLSLDELLRYGRYLSKAYMRRVFGRYWCGEPHQYENSITYKELMNLVKK